MRHIKLAVAAFSIWLGFCCCALAGVALISGTDVGSGQCHGSSTTGTTQACTTTADSPVGSLVVVVAGIRSSSQAITSCTDNAGTPNTYTASFATLINSVAIRVFYAVVTTDLPNAGTVTCTYGGTSEHRSEEHT